MNHEEFTKKIESLDNIELIEMAKRKLIELCRTGGKSFTMTVPPRIDDDDILFSELIRRFNKSLE